MQEFSQSDEGPLVSSETQSSPDEVFCWISAPRYPIKTRCYSAATQWSECTTTNPQGCRTTCLYHHISSGWKVLGGAQLAAKPSLRLPRLKHTCPVAKMRLLTAEAVRLKESQIKLSVSNFTATILQQQ